VSSDYADVCRYEVCEKYGIAHQNTGKWVVAQTPEQAKYLDGIHKHASSLDIPVRFVSKEEAERDEPAVRANQAVLESSSTGIVDSHAFMLYLLGQFESQEGDIVYRTKVKLIGPKSGGGFDITCVTEDGEETSIDTGVLVNSAGLYACDVSNMLLPEERQMKPYYAKGNYFSYTLSKPKTKRLIYPCPDSAHFAGYLTQSPI
jgi:2-hydroxyglutarate dehydrogenase